MNCDRRLIPSIEYHTSSSKPSPGRRQTPLHRVVRLEVGYWLIGLLVALAVFPAITQAQSGVWNAPSFKAKKKNPVPAEEASIAMGKQYYTQECLACHGQTGRGDGPASKDLEKPTGDLTSPEMWSQTDGAIFFKITVGRRPMPSFREKFNTEQRWHLVNYIRTLTRTEASPHWPVPDANRQAILEVLQASYPLHAALVEGSLEKALLAKAELIQAVDQLVGVSGQSLPQEAGEAWTQTISLFKKSRNALEKADQLGALRKAFLVISYRLNTALTQFGHGQTSPVYLFYCSAAFDGLGGIWLQDTTTAHNPYLVKTNDGCEQMITTFQAAGQ